MSNETTLTLEEKHQIVVWNHNGFSDNEIQNLFPKMFGNRPVPSSTTIQTIMENLRTLGCLFPENHKMESKVKRLKQKRKRRNKKICEGVDQSPSHSSRETAHEVETSQDESKGLLLPSTCPEDEGEKCELLNIIKSEPEDI